MKLMGIERKFNTTLKGGQSVYGLDEEGTQSYTNICKSTPHKETETYFHPVKILSCELDLFNHTEEKKVQHQFGIWNSVIKRGWYTDICVYRFISSLVTGVDM